MNSSYSIHLFIFVTVICLWCSSPIEATTCHPDDEAGLLAFKSGITQDPSGMLSSWKKGTDCCSWKNVVCKAENRVTTLSIIGEPTIAESYLSGTLSPSLAKLQHLENFYLTNLKNITGSFPVFLLQLPKLKYIGIENNRFSGPLPTNIGVLSQLQVLSIEGNRFTGPIPSSISKIPWLFILNLGGNLLTGTIPSEFSNLKHIVSINLSSNHLSGTIPDIFTSMTELVSLVLSHNKFSGKLPPSIASLSPILTTLELGHNNLSGTFPSCVLKLKELNSLDLSWNQFSGVVPMSFTKLTKLMDLDLSHNLLTDPFPLLRAKDITTLDLSYNNFHLKTIPKWVTSARITTLKLVKCGIKMSLDNWKPKRTNFTDIIDLSENDISGSPKRLLKATQELREFHASGNKLQFDMETLNFTKTLHTLDLSKNLIFGKVPSIVVGLRKLNLSQNHLCGKLPVTKFTASAFAGNDCLCGSPLAPCKVQ